MGLRVTDNEGATGTTTGTPHIDRPPVVLAPNTIPVGHNGSVTFDPKDVFTDPDRDALTIVPAPAPFKESDGSPTQNPDGSSTDHPTFGVVPNQRAANPVVFLSYSSRSTERRSSSAPSCSRSTPLSIPSSPGPRRPTAHRSVTTDPVADAAYPDPRTSDTSVSLGSAWLATANSGQVSIAGGKLVLTATFVSVPSGQKNHHRFQEVNQIQ